MRSVTVSQSLLQSLLGDSFEAVLLGRLGLNEATKAVTRQMPQHLNAPLLEAMSDQYTGPARRLFAQTKTLEYLGLLVDFLHAKETIPRQGRHTQKIRELKEFLLSLDGRLPALNSLATDFGLSAKQLNIEFQAEFGQSIFDYVTTIRLDQAHAALLESPMPICWTAPSMNRARWPSGRHSFSSSICWNTALLSMTRNLLMEVWLKMGA